MSSRVTSGRLTSAQVWLLWFALGAVLAGGVGVAGYLSVLPELPGRVGADPMTGLASVLGDLLARLSATVTAGLLAALVVFWPAGEDDQVPAHAEVLARWVVRSGQLWFAAALAMTFINPAYLVALPLSAAFRPDQWWVFLTTTPSALAWLVAALAALAAVAVGYRARRRTPFLLAWLLGLAATVFVAVTGNVSVGLDHDWATDAMAAATVARVLFSSGLVALVALCAVGQVPQAAAQRFHRAAPALLAAMGLGYGLVVWQQLAGEPLAAVAYGSAVIPAVLLLGLLALSWLGRQSLGLARTAQSRWWLVGEAVMMAAALLAMTAVAHVPPPRFLLAQSAQVNYLGYEVDVPATLERLVGPGRPNLAWVVLVLLAVFGYLWGMARVRRLGGRWPAWRLLFWLAGWLLMLYLAVSGLWLYSTAVFSWHMLVHMTVNMLVPLLCVLGSPFELLHLASRQGEPGQLPGGRQLLAGLAANRVVRTLLSPPLVWVAYVSSLFVVYFSPLFGWLMRYHWAHQLMLLHFLVTGYAFFSLLVGPDRQLWKLPHIVKFALLLSVMPFHAIFAVGIMMSQHVIGEQFYRTIDVAWVGDLLADQNIAGQITWFTGEVPVFIAVIMLAAQWFRSDDKESRLADEAIDGGESVDDMAAYNDMLAQLARRAGAEDRR